MILADRPEAIPIDTLSAGRWEKFKRVFVHAGIYDKQPLSRLERVSGALGSLIGRECSRCRVPRKAD